MSSAADHYTEPLNAVGRTEYASIHNYAPARLVVAAPIPVFINRCSISPIIYRETVQIFPCEYRGEELTASVRWGDSCSYAIMKKSLLVDRADHSVRYVHFVMGCCIRCRADLG